MTSISGLFNYLLKDFPKLKNNRYWSWWRQSMYNESKHFLEQIQERPSLNQNPSLKYRDAAITLHQVFCFTDGTFSLRKKSFDILFEVAVLFDKFAHTKNCFAKMYSKPCYVTLTLCSLEQEISKLTFFRWADINCFSREDISQNVKLLINPSFELFHSLVKFCLDMYFMTKSLKVVEKIRTVAILFHFTSFLILLHGAQYLQCYKVCQGFGQA